MVLGYANGVPLFNFDFNERGSHADNIECRGALICVVGGWR